MINSEELKKKHLVFGSYYSFISKQGELVSLRNVLDIYDKNAVNPLNFDPNLVKINADCFFIMMNPGSSAPLDKSYSPRKIDLKNDLNKLSNLDLIPAKPDITQYQVMRVMHEMNWKFVRVFNLSDLIQTKSAIFIKSVAEFETKFGDLHSIFSQKRAAEFEILTRNYLKAKNFVIGCGCDKALEPIADKVYARISHYKIWGLPCKNGANLYMHPSPTLQKHKENWLTEIVKQIKKDCQNMF